MLPSCFDTLCLEIHMKRACCIFSQVSDLLGHTNHEAIRSWLCRFTEADLRMYPTIIRYDGCYTTLFKCSKKRIGDYPNLSAWLRDVYQLTVPNSPSLQVNKSRCTCLHEGISLSMFRIRQQLYI